MSAAAIRPPVVGDPDAPFWAALPEGRFLLHVCAACGRSYWPASCCVDHGAGAMEWREGSRAGTVETFTVFHRAYRPLLADRVPYVVAVIRLDDGPYFHTNIVDGDWRAALVGARAEWIGPGPDADAGRAMFRLVADRS